MNIIQGEKEDTKKTRIKLLEMKTTSEMENTLNGYKGYHCANFSVYHSNHSISSLFTNTKVSSDGKQNTQLVVILSWEVRATSMPWRLEASSFMNIDATYH